MTNISLFIVNLSFIWLHTSCYMPCYTQSWIVFTYTSTSLLFFVRSLSIDAHNKYHSIYTCSLFCWGVILNSYCIPVNNFSWSTEHHTFIFISRIWTLGHNLNLRQQFHNNDTMLSFNHVWKSNLRVPSPIINTSLTIFHL